MEGIDENRLIYGGSRKIYKKGSEVEDIRYKSIEQWKHFREIDYSGILRLSSPKPMVGKSSSDSQLSNHSRYNQTWYKKYLWEGGSNLRKFRKHRA